MNSLDIDILVRFKKGDDKALAYIFKLYHKGLCYFARQLVNDDRQAEDIVADTFLKLWQRHTDFKTLSNIKNFLYITTRHSCYDYLKHIRRKAASHEEILHLAQKDEDYIESRMILA
jgi:RNA polymerase sigma factor (sigma-70 family)